MIRISRFRPHFGRKRAAVYAAFLSGMLLCAEPALADEPSAQDRASAGEAFDRGTSLWLSKNYAEAARYFETAHRLAPASGALVQAVRAHVRAKNMLRAATLSLRLQALYPDDKLAAKTAKKGLAKWEKSFARVDVACDACTVELDGTIVSHPSFFVEPDTEHTVVANFPTGSETKSVHAEAGETIELAFEAPPEPEPEPEAPPPDEPVLEVAPPGPTDVGGEPYLKPTVPIILGAATVGMGAVLVWSGVDTLNANDTYEQDPTRNRLNNGRDLERRTNILLGLTVTVGAAAVTTTVLAILKKKPDSKEAAKIRPDVAVNRRGGFVTLGGSFR